MTGGRLRAGAGRMAAAGLLLALTPGAERQQQPWLDRCLDAEPTHRWLLPAAFREVSGLALSDDGRLFFHNDEQGILAAIDPAKGTILATYRLGPGTPRDDFEGIAIRNDRLFLVTSRGLLYESRVPAPGPVELGMLPFRIVDTGLGRECEIEGLGVDADGSLLVACKTARRKRLEDWLTLFRWNPDRQALAEPDRIQVPLDDLAKGRPGKRFHASGVERDPSNGRLIVVAAADDAIAEMGPTGEAPRARELPKRHRQAEGIAIDKAGRLILSDEGGRGHGSVTVYACR
ncbi:MAG: SdiA-regulated domain-containing protein [Gemmatimonadales bacterium]